MRFSIVRVVSLFIFILNITALYHVWKLFFNSSGNKKQESDVNTELHANNRKEISIESNVTIVIRSFEHFENDIPATVRSLKSAFPKYPVMIISNTPPYPPLFIQHENSVRVFVTSLQLENSYQERNPLHNIHTKYVLIVPDSIRIHSNKIMHKLLRAMEKPVNIVSASLMDGKSKCLKIKLNVKQWTLEYNQIVGMTCDSVVGMQIIFTKTSTLNALSDPFLLPTPEALYIQAAAKSMKVKMLNEVGKGSVYEQMFGIGKPLFTTKHARWKHDQSEQRKRDHMYRTLGIKKVVRENGIVEWYGCTRETSRCFPTVIDDIPQYLWQGKWTPPCCLEGLRRTARHVLTKLASAGVRHWLEGGSLLGAMRYGDIIPWDYDVDLGMYMDDMPLLPVLVRAQFGPVIDEEGFVWEKATEGKFFRVQFSKFNRLHVDIFPFYPKNGTMTKDTWFRTHVQDREFPERFLHPMSDIEFIGMRVPAPNNIHEFLEYKFGKGVVEHPEYPNPEKLKFTHEEKIDAVDVENPYEY